MAQYQPLTEEELTEIYGWVDGIPLSRVKKNIARDFSDGVLMAEIIHYFAPTVIELHNYNETYSVTRKTYNWNTLNRKSSTQTKIFSIIHYQKRFSKEWGFSYRLLTLKTSFMLVLKRLNEC